MSEGGCSSPLSSPPESIFNDDTPAKPSAVQSKNKASSPPKDPYQIMERATEMKKIYKEQQNKDSITPESSPDETKKRKATSQGCKGSSSKNPRRSVSGPKKSAQDKKWDPPFVYTDAQSPLATANLRAILLLPGAWDVLTEEEKREILAKLPDETHVLDAGTEGACPNIESLRNDDNFRNDCARYCENIELGRHDEQWLSEAWVAHERHKRGDFNDHLEQKFEDDWEVEFPKEYRLKRPRESLDSSASETRRDSGDAIASQQKGAQQDSSPAVPRRHMENLTLAGTPPVSEPGSPQNRSPNETQNQDDNEMDDAGIGRSTQSPDAESVPTLIYALGNPDSQPGIPSGTAESSKSEGNTASPSLTARSRSMEPG